MKSLTPDIAPRALDRGLRSETLNQRRGAEQANFAEQLIGAKSGGLESPDRNERNIKSLGRDGGDEPVSREGRRSVERDRDSQGPQNELRARKQSSMSSRSSSLAHERAEDRRRPERTRQTLEQSAQSPVDLSQRQYSRQLERRIEGNVEEAEVEGEGAKAESANPNIRLPDFYSREALSREGSPANGVSANRSDEAKAAGDKSVQMLEAMREDQVHSREEAMDKFLGRMQDELGIPPEKVLNAFSQLDPKSLAAPPEETMTEFIQNLDLQPAQEGTAKAFYKDMLHSTGEADLNEKLIGMQEGVKFDVLSQHDSSMRNLSHALDDLNTSFFRKDGPAAEPKKAQAAVESMNAELSRLMQGKGDIAQDDDDDGGLGPWGMAGAGAALGAVAGAGAGAGETAAAGGKSVKAASIADSDSPIGIGAGGGHSHALRGFSHASSSSANSGDDLAGDEKSFSGGDPGHLSSHQAMRSSTDTSFSQHVAGADSVRTEAAGQAGMPGAASDATGSPAVNPAAAGATAPRSAGAAAIAMGPSGMMMNRQASANDEQENIRELVKQAQLVLKNGGGEMKMEMKPEGMGQVHLKVSVENGQVNVQMLTDNEQAKHLLEKGLGDLKESLASHQLRVDHMKVDVGQDIQKQMDQNGNREHARQFAQDFMGQFRDDRQDARDGMFGNTGWRSYGHAQKRATVEPDSASRSAAAQRSENSRRLNLVA